MNVVLKTTAKLTALVGLLMLSLPSLANEKAAATESLSPLTYEPTLENRRDPNRYCAGCHKFDSNGEQSGGEFHFGKFHGRHLQEKNPNNGKGITCVSCHGNISEDHRRGMKDVMRFQSDIFGDKKPMFTVEEQNQVCFACHQPKKLQEKLWAHDVHAMKLPCASCHTLHPESDAMKGIEPKEQVKLCVDCHGEQQKRLESGLAATPALKQKD